MSYLRPLFCVALCLVLLAGPAPATAAATPSPTTPPVSNLTPAPRERDALDRFSSVAAVVGIVLVGAAGFYLYGLIRKGL